MKKCDHKEAVKWNPYNKVVQCHKCGKIFDPLTFNSNCVDPTDT